MAVVRHVDVVWHVDAVPPRCPRRCDRRAVVRGRSGRGGIVIGQRRPLPAGTPTDQATITCALACRTDSHSVALRCRNGIYHAPLRTSDKGMASSAHGLNNGCTAFVNVAHLLRHHRDTVHAGSHESSHSQKKKKKPWLVRSIDDRVPWRPPGRNVEVAFDHPLQPGFPYARYRNWCLRNGRMHRTPCRGSAVHVVVRCASHCSCQVRTRTADNLVASPSRSIGFSYSYVGSRAS
jgi:hypothetical protein